MKKRLLITSIVMMLVVAVALSTATYAWFTSNASVTANSVTMTAGVSDQAALGIAWFAGSGSGATFNSAYETEITPYAYTGALQPAAPAELTNAEPTFYTAFLDSKGVFNSAATEHDVFRFANKAAPSGDSDATYSNVVHVVNLAASGSKTVTLSATITPHYIEINSDGEAVNTATYNYYDADKAPIASPSGTLTSGYKVEKDKDASDLVRIAVFELTEGTEPYDTYTYKGLMATATVAADENNTAVGSITKDVTTAASLLTGDATETIDLGSFAAQTDKAYAIYVWLDGGHFNEAESGKTADVALTFTAA